MPASQAVPILALTIITASWACSEPATAASQGSRPDFEVLRYEEDWSNFRSRASDDPLDAAKNIQLGPSSTSSITFGGQVRGLYEFTDKPGWGEAPAERNGVLYDRYLVHGDLRLGERVRLFGQLISGFSRGEAGPDQGVGEDRLGIQNLFVDVGWPASNALLTLRVGRQQLAFGLNRLVNERDGTNIPRTFDSARLILTTANWRVDVFGAYGSEEETGTFDDGTNQDVALWGVYSVRERALPSGGALDVYYLGFRDREAAFDQGTGHETRHSIGIRAFGNAGSWDYDWEVIGQFGTFADDDIRAWSVATITGYTWQNMRWSPRLALESAIASGDDDPGNADLQTFNPLFPSGDYFSELGLLGPANFINVKPKLTLTLSPRLSVSLDVNLYWRHSREDGIYSPPRMLLRPGADSDARYVATTASFVSEWQISRRLHLLVGYTRSFPGEFVRDTGEDDPINFVEIEFGFTF